MSNALTIVEIKNKEEELLSLPLKSPIYVEFSEAIDMVDAKDYIKVIKVTSAGGIGNIPKSYSDYVIHDTLMFVDIDISLNENILTILPKDSYEGGCNYAIYLLKGLKGFSESVSDDRVLKFFNADDLLYQFEAKTSKTRLSNGSEVVVFKITDNNGKDYGIHKIELGKEFILNNLKVTFSDEDYSIGETILLDKSDKTLLLEDYLIEFKTNLSEIYKRPEITSEVVSKDDVLNFFKNPFMSKEQIEAQEEEAEKEPLYTYRLSYPNKIIIDFKNPVDIATINPDNFDIEISEAFGNYHLGKMGYYDECRFYKISVVFSKNNKRMTISLLPLDDSEEEHDDNIVEVDWND